jgi:ABC-type sugar transport system permease subunit
MSTAARPSGQVDALARSDARFALSIVGVVIVLNAVIVIVPVIYAAWMSLHDTDVILRRQEFIGLKHYSKLLGTPEAVNSMLLSFEFALVTVIASLLVGLAMALVLNEDFPGRQLLRAAILIPWAVSEVATATAWIFILNPTFGALTGVLHPLGLVSENHVWIDEHTALYWVAAAFVWHIAPLGAFFFLAALQTVPDSLYQAARIDRASMLSRFVHVTLPHLRTTIMVVLVVVTVEAFRSFDLLFAMTRGGPGTASQVFPMLIFRYTFEFSRYGLAAAASYLLVAVGMIVTTAYFLVLRQRRRQVRLAVPEQKAAVAAAT